MTDREKLFDVSQKLLAISKEISDEFPGRGEICRNIHQVVNDVLDHIEEELGENG